MCSLTATYSPDDNKLRIYASDRLDAHVYSRLKAAGFRHAPKQELFVAPMWTPEREDLALELCGAIGDEETSLLDRANERAERFTSSGNNRLVDSATARNKAVSISNTIPFGQPILVGHHSEGRARKDAGRIDAHMRRSIQLWDDADYWKRRAAAAVQHAEYRERSDVRARRINRLATALRKHEKEAAAAKVMLSKWQSSNVNYDHAIFLASLDHIYIPDGTFTSLWSALNDKTITQSDAVTLATDFYNESAHRNDRWIGHFQLRLMYERAMCDGSSSTPV
ncbi:hypothetical protein PS623_04627 [Pseudomonas fluorescens]|uniref:DUF3560 domain-containing protein n=1 Tax=Pseudomonas fluorescens TaxID=294 RepID=UPI001242EAA8|nr:DUF3560 domain-containing protein [Pseudomonas fluorescens]VVN27836.1 hypothetical protein PS623_04627 [Pseudomonas fluorescens]